MRKLLLATTLLAASIGAAQSATIVNGGLEGNPNNPYQTLPGGSTAINGWTVSGGSADWIGNLWQHAEGNNSVDLSGNAPGGLTQMINDLVKGVTYEIRFALAGNPDGLPDIKTLKVNIGDDEATYTFDATSTTRSAMGWVYEVFRFTAGDTSETLAFTSVMSGNFYGPAIDDISIAAVPLPATGLLLFAGLGGLVLARRRKA